MMIRHEHWEWRDMLVAGADVASHPRLLLVGDSIARSYSGHVEDQLKDAYLCARLTSSTSVCDRAIEKELSLLLDDYSFAVIHFNNGLHGWEYDDEKYGKGLRRVLRFITVRSPHSRLIAANTTPVRCANNLDELDPRTDRVRERNRLMCNIATELGLPVNDLFSLVLNHPEHFSADGVHFSPTGQAVLGRQVVEAIRNLKVGEPNHGVHDSLDPQRASAS